MSLRVFAPPGVALRTGVEVDLDDEESHYLARVRRATPGDAVEILDGVAEAFSAMVVDVGSAARVRIEAPIPSPPVVPLELALGLPAPRATLDAVAVACETAATRIVLVRCERSHPGAPSPQRIARVIRAAQRQCGCPRPPGVEGPLSLSRWLAEPGELPGFFAWAALRGRPTPLEAGAGVGARLLVGPEGGLTSDEAESARTAGLQPLGLGPWTLRTETAVAAGLARLLAR